MTQTMIRCDRCTREIGEKKRRGITLTRVLGHEPDPSGNGYIANMKSIDVCQECIQVLMTALWNQNIITDKLSLAPR